MPMRTDEEVNEQVRALLQAGTPWQTIRQQTGVSNSVIQRVRREGGLVRNRRPEPAPKARHGDGMTEFLPPEPTPEPTPESGSESPVRSAPIATTPESTPEPAPESGSESPVRSAPFATAPESGSESPERSAPERRRGGCSGCGARWAYDLPREAPAACPACGRRIVYGCSACGRRFWMDPGDVLPDACPRCGEAS
jgi:DNA-directed RNA polymerase subunit RPC12/RpoP